MWDQIREYDKNRDDKYAKRGGYVTQPLMTNSLDDRSNLQYEIHYEGETIIPRKQWVWGKERLLEAINNNEVVFKKKQNGEYSVRAKVYLKDEGGKIRKGKPLSLLNGPFNQEGTKEVAKLLGGNIFSFPKPSALIRHFFGFTINNEEEESGIYLDFFSGSCSSAHAVLTLNEEDGGQRRFIMVQLPEPCDKKSEAFGAGYLTISNIGKERLRRVIKRILSELKQKNDIEDAGLPGLNQVIPKLDVGFKACTLSSSNIKPWDADFDTMEQDLLASVDNIKSDRSEHDVPYELLLKYGLDLAIPTETRTIEERTVTVIGAGALIVCLADDITLEVVAGIAALKDELKPEVMRVVFKDSGFKDDVAKTNAAQILKQAGIDDVKSL